MSGFRLWADQINARGGLLGRSVELVTYDDGSDPETGARLYEKLISEDRVDLVLGPYSTAVTLPASTVTEKHHYVMVGAGAAGTDVWARGYRYVFGIHTVAPLYVEGVLDLAAARGYHTVALVNEDSAFAKDVMAGAERKANALGLQVVLHEQYGRDVR